MNIKFKFDYCKLGAREDFGTTVNKDLLLEFKILSKRINQPMSKCLDVMLDMILNDEKLLDEFKDRIRKY